MNFSKCYILLTFICSHNNGDEWDNSSCDKFWVGRKRKAEEKRFKSCCNKIYYQDMLLSICVGFLFVIIREIEGSYAHPSGELRKNLDHVRFQHRFSPITHPSTLFILISRSRKLTFLFSNWIVKGFASEKL